MDMDMIANRIHALNDRVIMRLQCMSEELSKPMHYDVF